MVKTKIWIGIKIDLDFPIIKAIMMRWYLYVLQKSLFLFVANIGIFIC